MKHSLAFFLLQALWSALHWTAQEGHTEVARLLLERGAIANTQDKVYNDCSCVYYEHTVINMAACMQAGFTPLLQASQDGRLDIVKVLVEHSGIVLDQHTMVILP